MFMLNLRMDVESLMHDLCCSCCLTTDANWNKVLMGAQLTLAISPLVFRTLPYQYIQPDQYMRFTWFKSNF